MLISNAKKFIFIETPKTASSSMRSLLECYEDEEHEFPKHMPAVGAVRKMGEERWQSYHSFAVMREPISWLHSWYKFWRGRATQGKLKEERKAVLDLGFEEFLRTAAVQSTDEAFGRIGLQRNRFCGPGQSNLLVSHLIRYEALPEEWDRLKKDLDLAELDDLPRRNVSLDKSTLPELDETTQAAVYKRWRKDFEIYEQLSSGAFT